MDDDGSGWHDVLLSMWGVATRDAVVSRLERSMVGRHGWLVRVFADPERVRSDLTEIVHGLVLAAIRDETGADLEGLGSQAAWECYTQVWDALAERWCDGGSLATVPLTREPEVVAAIARLPVEAAVAAGADIVGEVADPLWVAGRLRVDTEGLRAYLALDGGPVPIDVHAHVSQVLRATRGS